MRIAILTTIVPNTLKTGSEIATRALIAWFEELGHDVTLFAYGRSPFLVQAPVRSVLLGTIPIETAKASNAAKLSWAWRSLRSGHPISSEKYNYLPPDELEAEIERSGADLLIVDHVNLYPFVSRLVERRPVWVVFHDIQAASYAMVAKGERRPWWRAVYAREARLNAALERRAGTQARLSLFLSQVDADRARTEFGIERAAVLPLFFPVASDQAPSSVTAPATYDIGLIGTWTWPPVRQGILWFLDEVVPRLPREISIAVAGSGSNHLPGDRVAKLGLVPDSRAFLASTRVAAVPTVSGTGIQIKTLELAATGTPAVSTVLGVRGLDTVPANLRVAETADDFARALVEAVRRPRPHDREAGHAWNAERRRRGGAILAEALLAHA